MQTAPMPGPDGGTCWEAPAVFRARESRRGELVRELGTLLTELDSLSPDERGAWHREHRGVFFFAPGEIDARLAMLGGLKPQRKTEILEAAARLLRHEFNLLGSGPTSLGRVIDWHRDFKSGIGWSSDVVYPSWNWRRVDRGGREEIFPGHFYSIDDASDLKVPWDLSSFFHLAVLGEAFGQTGDEAYANEAVAQLRDWHERNPFPRGVNWTCAMVVGIRLANVVFGLRLLERHAGAQGFIAEIGLGSIVQHLRFILEELEIDRDGRRNNHYLNNLVGLAFGASELAASPCGAALLDFVHEEIERELGVQFSPDGTNYEGSIPYHRFATESVLLASLLLARNGRRLSRRGTRQFERMLRFIDTYTKPNGLAPQIGDNDNGRILVLDHYVGQEYRDHRHVLAVGAGWLGLSDLWTDVSGCPADTVWLLGQPPPARTAAARPEIVVAVHADNGFVIAKSETSSLVVRCGPIAAMSGGGHNHCDQLSFEYQDLGCDLIVDPGAGIYSGDAARRNAHRSTAAHNTLQLDDIEQQDFDPRDLFAMRDRAEARIIACRAGEGCCEFRSEHRAYAHAGWMVERGIRCDLRAGCCQVWDTLRSTGPRRPGGNFRGRLHLAPAIKLTAHSPTRFVAAWDARRWEMTFMDAAHVSVQEGQVSPSYGVAEAASVIEYQIPAREGEHRSFSLQRITP